MTTMATPLSVVRMILNQPFFSSWRALDSSMVILGFGVYIIKDSVKARPSCHCRLRGRNVGTPPPLLLHVLLMGVFRDHHKIGAHGQKQSLHFHEVSAGLVDNPFLLCVVIVCPHCCCCCCLCGCFVVYVLTLCLVYEWTLT